MANIDGYEKEDQACHGFVVFIEIGHKSQLNVQVKVYSLNKLFSDF